MYIFQWLIVIQKTHKVFLLSLLYDRRPRIQILISTRKWRIRIRGRSKPFLHYGISQIESILYYKTCTVPNSTGYSKFRIISSPHQRIIPVCLKRKYKWAVQYCFSALIYNIDTAKYCTVQSTDCELFTHGKAFIYSTVQVYIAQFAIIS
jgi:hypothetical protein